MARNFWMVICNAENFGITRDHGFTILGLKGEHRRKVQRVEAGDRILYYVSGIRCFTATATATSSYTEDDTPIWQNEGGAGWPYRVSIKPEVVLDEPRYIDANILAPRLGIHPALASGRTGTWPSRGTCTCCPGTTSP